MAKKRGPGRPKLPQSERKIALPVRVSPALMKRVDDKALQNRVSVTEVVTATLENYLDFSIGGA